VTLLNPQPTFDQLLKQQRRQWYRTIVTWAIALLAIAIQMMDLTLYRWEYNFRTSTVMGAVGAGGIGFELIGALRLSNYREVSAVLLVILLMVIMVDGFSSYLRKRLV
jgi:ABC-type phosphate/phosphonate transport system permease subunit